MVSNERNSVDVARGAAAMAVGARVDRARIVARDGQSEHHQRRVPRTTTAINSKPIRHVILVHALLSWLFGAIIVATTINLIANLLR